MMASMSAWALHLAVALSLAPRSAAEHCDAAHLQKFGSHGWPTSLDSTIFWYGLNDVSERATGKKSTYYDPAKPTVILIDGWDGWTKITSCHRMTSFCVRQAMCPGKNTSVAQPWIEQGWNFGIFYWDQLADTECVSEAEVKVWSNKYWDQEAGLTWKSYNVTSGVEKKLRYTGPEKNVGELCANRVRWAMQGFSGPEFRFIGLSIAGQMVAKCAEVIYRETPNHVARPTRLILIDPTFQSMANGPHWKCVFPPTDHQLTLKYTIQAIQFLWTHGVTFELYKGKSMLTVHTPLFFNPAFELETLGPTVYWEFQFCGVGIEALHCRHEATLVQYLLQMGSFPVRLQNPESLSALPTTYAPGETCLVPGPKCSFGQIQSLEANQLELTKTKKRLMWTQIEGQSTWDQSDDLYKFEISAVPTDVRLDEPVDLFALPSDLDARELQKDWKSPIRKLTSIGKAAFVLSFVACIGLALFGGFRRSFKTHRAMTVTCANEESEDLI